MGFIAVKPVRTVVLMCYAKRVAKFMYGNSLNAELRLGLAKCLAEIVESEVQMHAVLHTIKLVPQPLGVWVVINNLYANAT